MQNIVEYSSYNNIEAYWSVLDRYSVERNSKTKAQVVKYREISRFRRFRAFGAFFDSAAISSVLTLNRIGAIERKAEMQGFHMPVTE